MSAVLGLGRGGANGAATLTNDLYKLYGTQIYAYCLRRLRFREEAEDAVQTTFLNAFRALQRGTSTHAEQAWLYKIAQHVCDGRGWNTQPAPFEAIEETVAAPQRERGDELIGLDAALDAMPTNQRRAIVLREWRGLSYREIADELQLTPTAVEMLIFRARRALAQGLEAPAAQASRKLYATA